MHLMIENLHWFFKPICSSPAAWNWILNHLAPGYFSSLLFPSSISYIFIRCSVVAFYYRRTWTLHHGLCLHSLPFCLESTSISCFLVSYFSFYKIQCRGQLPWETLPGSTNHFPSDSWYLEQNSIDAFITSYLSLVVYLLESPTRYRVSCEQKIFVFIVHYHSQHGMQVGWIENCKVILLEFFKNPFYF